MPKLKEKVDEGGVVVDAAILLLLPNNGRPACLPKRLVAADSFSDVVTSLLSFNNCWPSAFGWVASLMLFVKKWLLFIKI